MKRPSVRVGLSFVIGIGLTLALLWLAGGAVPKVHAATNWYVSLAGDDTNDCLSPGTACLTISQAVISATTGDTIHILAGTHLNTSVNIIGKALTFIGDGADQTILDGSDGAGGAGSQVFSSDSDLTFSDLTIQNGVADSGSGGAILASEALTLTNVNVLSSTARDQGGGVYVGAAATITGGRFENNQSTSSRGGGLFAGGPLSLAGTHFITNTATEGGGGACAASGATVSGAVFQGNQAPGAIGSGGGLLSLLGTLTLTDTQFLSNLAAFGGGGVYGLGAVTVSGGSFLYNTSDSNGGGLSVAGGAGAVLADTQFLGNTSLGLGGGLFAVSDVNLTNASLTSNTAGSDGGGFYASGAATVVNGVLQQNTSEQNCGAFSAGGPLTVSDTQVLSNTAVAGGGGACAYGAVTLWGNLFRNNTAGGAGGGLWVNAGDPLVITNTRFISNTAGTDGGGFHQFGSSDGSLVNVLFARNAAGNNGAALFLSSSGTVALTHNTVASPTVGAGSAIYVDAGTVNIADTIVASYTTGLALGAGLANSDYNLYFKAPTEVITGTNSVSGTNPLFLKPAADDYHLLPASPAWSRGTDLGVLDDLDGKPRPVPPSMGAYDLAVVLKNYLPLIRR